MKIMDYKTEKITKVEVQMANEETDLVKDYFIGLTKVLS